MNIKKYWLAFIALGAIGIFASYALCILEFLADNHPCCTMVNEHFFERMLGQYNLLNSWLYSITTFWASSCLLVSGVMMELTRKTYREGQRNGLLTLFLVCMIFGYTILAVILLIPNTEISMLGWIPISVMLCCMVNIICGVALFRWKKWGFFGILAVSCLSFSWALYEYGFLSACNSLIKVALLFALLHVGKDNKAWLRLS